MDFENENRIMTPGFTETDHDIEISLRPKALTEYIGQEKAKENLKIYIEAAKSRGDSLDHVLLYGPPGLGKTTLSNIIANEMESNIKTTSGPAIERPGDLAALLTNLSEGDVLFIDEIYSLVHDEHDSFGREALDTLVPYIENSRADLVVILAGYENLMRRFFSHNPGLESRFNTYIHFEDYSFGCLFMVTKSNYFS